MNRGRRGFWPLRDLPTVVWLLAAGVSTLVHPFVPAPRWLMIHLLLLGAISHAILVWSTYFTDAVLHIPAGDADRRAQSARLLLLNAGVVAVVVGVPGNVWPVTAAGAAMVAGAVGWHGAALLLRLRRALPARFGATVRYYVAAAVLLPVGAGIGAALGRGIGGSWHERLVFAHAAVNVLGWMGLTVVGTLVTLWPTMLRTRIAAGAERAAKRALPVLVAAVLTAAAGAAADLRPVAALGVAGYLAGLGLTAPALVKAARGRRPSSFPTWSVVAGLVWLAGSLAALAVGIGIATSWPAAAAVFERLTPFLAVGFGAQVLLGALSYLVPAALGGGATPVRAANSALERGGALRVAMTNAALVVCALPVPSMVRVLASTLALAGLASFLPLLLLAIRSSRRARSRPAVPAGGRRPDRPEASRPPGRASGPAVAGLAAVVLAVAAGIAADPAALARGGPSSTAAAGVTATGATTTVRVKAEDMRFTPATISVPAGNRLVIVLTNTDDQNVHDLVLDAGASSGRLRPGDAERVDAGVVGRDIEGWCSVVGHRQMGMVLHIEAAGGSEAAAADEGDHADHRHGPAGAAGAAAHGPGDTAGETPGQGPGRPGTAGSLDFAAEPGEDFTARDASLPPVHDGRVHRHTFTVRELDRAVAPGTAAHLWTYNGRAPGPVLRGKVGDVFEIRLVNDGRIGHSIDFHAGALVPDRPMRTIAPGESLVYRFTATKAGIWMYHCATAPVSAHIANGLFGAVVIEPSDLPEVDRSYVLVQSELYLDGQGVPVDADEIRAGTPDAVVFNGYANQYDHRPLTAKVGERVRIWVLDAGPNRATSFHVIGGQFDAVWAEGGYLLEPGTAGGAQSLGLHPAQGGFVELTFPEPGRYPFLTHVMVNAEQAPTASSKSSEAAPRAHGYAPPSPRRPCRGPTAEARAE